VDGVIAQLNPAGIGQPLTNRPVGGKARWRSQRLLQLGELRGGEWLALAGGDVDGEQGVQAAPFIGGQPAPNGVAVNTQEGGNLLAEAGLTAGQQIQRMESLLPDRMAFLFEPMF